MTLGIKLHKSIIKWIFCKSVDAVGQTTFATPDRVPEGVATEYRADLVGFRHAGALGAFGSGLGCNIMPYQGSLLFLFSFVVNILLLREI
jgi:hypothetical protein